METYQLLKNLNQIYMTKLEKKLKKHGVTLAYSQILIEIYRSRNIKQSELIKKLNISQPTLSITIKRMIRDGFIVKQVDPNDNRSVNVYLSPKSLSLEDFIVGTYHNFFTDISKSLSEIEMNTLNAILSKLINVNTDKL